MRLEVGAASASARPGGAHVDTGALLKTTTRKVNGDRRDYDAYLKAAKREDSAYQELTERLKRKPPEQETVSKEKRKKA